MTMTSKQPRRHRGAPRAFALLILMCGLATLVAATTKIFSERTLENTDKKLDIAIEGDGFLQINLPSGTPRYTRDGALRMNSTGNIVTTDGYVVQPQITIPQDTLSISIGTDGTVSVLTAGAPTKATWVGTLTLVRFLNPAGLSSERGNLYSETSASGSPIIGTPGADGFATIRQGIPGALQRRGGFRTGKPDPGSAGV